jgi:AcrR family transcriptional regulator
MMDGGKMSGEDRRDEIALSALELFLEKGFAGTSMSAVAKAVGVRKASLYHHFASKEELFIAALAADVAAPLEWVEALNAQTGLVADERFAEALGLFHDAMVGSSIGSLATVISETSRMVPAVAEAFHDNFIARFVTLLMRVYEPCVSAGTHRDLPAVTIHDVVFGPLLSTAMTEAMFRQSPHIAEKWREGRSREDFVRRTDALLRV